MVNDGENICSVCGGKLKYYDTVKRIVRTKNRNSKRLYLRRMRCTKCGYLHRELPDCIYPYKQYEADIIIGVIEGLITSETLGFEDYPCEATMEHWRASQNLQGLL